MRLEFEKICRVVRSTRNVSFDIGEGREERRRGRLKCFLSGVRRFRSDSWWVYALTVITQSENEQCVVADKRAERFICVIGRLRENIVGLRPEAPRASRLLPRAYSRTLFPPTAARSHSLFFRLYSFFPLSLTFSPFRFKSNARGETDVDKVITTEIKCADK